MNEKGESRVSVIIPAYFSSATIAAALDALRGQSFRDFEVIVVNSSPEEETGLIVRGGYPEVDFVQVTSRLLPHAARNAGIERSRGELLVFTDPDCEADPGWLASMVAAFDSGAESLVGSMGMAGEGWMEKGIHLCKFHWLLPGLPNSVKTCAPTANAAYSRDLWSRIGPFPGNRFAGDGIVSRRAARLGHPPVFVPGALTLHRHGNRLLEFLAQRFSRGREYSMVQLRDLGPAPLVTWMRLLFSWASPAWVLLRAGKHSFHAGWGGAYLLTIPVQAAGHLSWALGESLEALRLLVGPGRAKGGGA